MKSASDAEEYSEQLDLLGLFQTLEMLMEGAGGHEKLTQIADDLITSNMLTTAVKNELVKYNTRRDQLLIPAKERQLFLESGVHESQEFEQQLLNCQSWIAHVDYILSARLNSDILASDVPQEYKQLQTEFTEHDDCITNLEKQVQRYRNHNKPEAANRLEEQINHVK
uniref:Uncharacterized protein n=1 Tax=Romanomermis culicivorax TaxID=13658 RepID=A0A915HI35_ROMCU